jgi:GNAT superfamily N-acetyltransferase
VEEEVILSEPVLLTSSHEISEFDCGKAALNDWLRNYALANQEKGFTRVVVVHSEMRVVGFYGLAPTAVPPNALSRKVRTGRPPDPVPCILLGQLAVDRNWMGHGIGSGLLQDAMRRCLSAAATIGGRAVIVRAIDADAERFWTSRGFQLAKAGSSTLFRSIDDISLSLEIAAGKTVPNSPSPTFPSAPT